MLEFVQVPEPFGYDLSGHKHCFIGETDPLPKVEGKSAIKPAGQLATQVDPKLIGSDSGHLHGGFPFGFVIYGGGQFCVPPPLHGIGDFVGIFAPALAGGFPFGQLATHEPIPPAEG